MYTNPYIPMRNGPGTNSFGQVEAKKAEKNGSTVRVDSFTDTAEIRNGTFSLYLTGFSHLGSGLSVGVHKLFDILLLQFSQQNSGKNKNPNEVIKLPLEDYMILCGIIDKKPSKGEAGKIKSLKTEARKQVKNYLDILSHVFIQWDESDGKNTRYFSKMPLITGYEIKNSVIVVAFSVNLAEYLVGRRGVTQYPTALLKLDGRNSNTYYLGKKLVWHYGLTKNVRNHRNNYISVSSLLNATPGLSQDKDLGHWNRRIRVPFENALNILVKAGIISEWKYCLAKKCPIENFSADGLTFSDFSKLYITFEIDGFPLPALKAS